MRRYDPAKHHRRSVRLKGYDYRRAGAYFVTICLHHRRHMLGGVVDGVMYLNDVGLSVEYFWDVLPTAFPTVSLCDSHECLAESGAIYFTSLEVREGCARFPLSQRICPMIVKHNLSHFRSH